MPSIESRTHSSPEVDGYVNVERPSLASGAVPEFPLSTEGTVPARDLIPPEFMNDSDIRKIFPNSPYLTRGFVDVNTFIRNTALQALAKT